MKEWFELKELNSYEKYLHKQRYDYSRKILKGKVLDIGCGSGYNLTNKRWVGIDIDKDALKIAKQRGRAKYGSIENIPFKKASFDGVSCLEVID